MSYRDRTTWVCPCPFYGLGRKEQTVQNRSTCEYGGILPLLMCIPTAAAGEVANAGIRQAMGLTFSCGCGLLIVTNLSEFGPPVASPHK